MQENHYLPFGLAAVGLDWNADSHRESKFTYNGKEKVTDFGLHWQDFHARFYDPQIGRTPTLDPHADSYHPLSSYSFLANNPLLFVDPDGKDIRISYEEDGKKVTYTYTYQKDRKFNKNTPDFLKNTIEALDHLYKNNALTITFGKGENAKEVDVLNTLIGDDKNYVTIRASKFGKSGHHNRIIAFNGEGAEIQTKHDLKDDEYDGVNSPAAVLGHELFHAYNRIYDTKRYFERS